MSLVQKSKYHSITNKKQRYKACAEICLGFSVIEYQYVKETKAAEPCWEQDRKDWWVFFHICACCILNSYVKISYKI